MSASPREIIAAVAAEFLQASVDAHAQAMSLMRRSVRLEQLATILTDAQCDAMLDALVAEGLIEIVDGQLTTTNSPGGAA